MADFLKAVCSNCGAKYRLPVEYQGRSARCKKCNTKFRVPMSDKTVEDSVLDWLAESDHAEEEEEVAKPRIIRMSEDGRSKPGDNPNQKGPIRLKSNSAAANE